jgi:AcrR family transcriptional regulator
MPKISEGTIAEHKRATTDRILEAWAALTAEKGYDATSLADVAQRAGVGRTAMYNYFADKEALLVAHTQRQLAGFLTELDDALAAADTPRERLRAFVHHNVMDFATRPLLPGPDLRSVLGPAVYAQLAAHTEPLSERLHAIIADGAAAGDFAGALDVESTATLAFACIGAERVPVGSGEHSVEEADARILTFLSNALGAAPFDAPA